MRVQEKYMSRCFELAEQGIGYVSPNPLVGCVISKNEVIVAEGFHQKYGEAHAEVNAINALPDNINPADCTLYVNLEPCSHFGKTPPCSDLIISKGFKNVVISNLDPNPLVSGSGIAKLKEAGINVTVGILEQSGRYLNRRFFTYQEKKRPHIILKWAQSADGYIAGKGGIPIKISGAESLKIAHKMRAQEDAVLVGKNTVLNDNPFLTTRYYSGKNPVRIILGGNGELDSRLNVFNNEAKTIIYNTKKTKYQDNLLWFKTTDIDEIVQHIMSLSIGSFVVEGGEKTLKLFINNNLWDEMHVFLNPNLIIENGVKAPDINLNTDYQIVNKDRYYHLIKGRNEI